MTREITSSGSLKELVLKKKNVLYLTIKILYYVCTFTSSIIWVYLQEEGISVVDLCPNIFTKKTTEDVPIWRCL